MHGEQIAVEELGNPILIRDIEAKIGSGPTGSFHIRLSKAMERSFAAADASVEAFPVSAQFK
ncbi:MAG: hypothetical protein ACK4XK_14165, partial [Casimicrobiaceae bacterium]